ncbi:hypothetical protein V1264_014484 [Littorina saxatilis]|uniref:Major facilitator superfamily (MFS) profile domain-containing protein n=1 Tax=Littorina saxatilis TaxID=31220 RepID=A0AAN9GL23_9CAEN
MNLQVRTEKNKLHTSKTSLKGPKTPAIIKNDDVADDDVESFCDKMTSCRWVIGYMCCAARFSQSAIRQCIGMAVVCMMVRTAEKTTTKPTVESFLPVSQLQETVAGQNVSFNGTVAHNVSTGMKIGDLEWTPGFEGLILNAYNIGFFFSPIIGGHIAGRFGGKRVVLVALLAGSIVTICLPLAANFNYIFIIVLRILAGVFLGVVDPAIQALWARWAPKHEKAQLTTCSYSGLSLAGIVTFYISGKLCGVNNNHGWPLIFYFFGGFAFFCSIPWIFLVYDSPEQHPRILDYELNLIAKEKDPSEGSKTVKTPWKSMLTSGPFWAIAVAHITYTWVTSWMMSYLPMYLSDVMKFNVEEDGLYSSLPYVGRLLSGFVCSYLSDKLQHSGVLSTGSCRKLFQLVGCLGCAACALAVGFLDHTSRGVAVALLVLAMSFQNVTSLAFRINHLDIAPRFAGVMMGITVTGAMGVALSGPPITEAIIKNDTQEEWLIVFIIVASLNIVGGVVFCIFSSGEVQDWALPQSCDIVITVCDVDTLGPSTSHDSTSHDRTHEIEKTLEEELGTSL